MTHKVLINKFFYFLITSILFLFANYAHAITENISVRSGIDNTALVNQDVTVYKFLDDGTRKGVKIIKTNTKGELSLDLSGLGIDTEYELKTLPKHGSRPVYSGKILATGSFAFKVANVRIKAVNGLNNAILANHKILAYKQNTDGSSTYFSSATTDSLGFVDFQLSDIASQPYLFKAASLSDGRTWESELISSAGTSNFMIGNKLLNVTVSSGIDNSPLAAQEVILYQLPNSGTRQWYRSVTTDSNGQLTLNLPGLGSDIDYELRTQSKQGSLAVFSGKISATGNFAFKVANVQVKAIDGLTNNKIAGHKVIAYKQKTDGSFSYVSSTKTDASGLADFQLDNISSQTYLFKAASLSDGRIWESELITSSGVANFVIGNKLLNVTVSSGVDNAPLTNQVVTLYQLKTDGSRQSLRTVSTDSKGALALDLPGLGIGTDYELKTLPKHGSREVYSGKISATGSFAFKVANIRIKAIDGRTNKPMAEHKVLVYKQNAEGSTVYFSSVITDASGLADIQLADIASQPYLFKTASLSDGRIWGSELITSTGTSNFVIGNKLLNVAITSGIDNAPLANQLVTLYQLKADGSRQSIRTITTNNQGLLALDLPGLGIDTNYELKTLPKHGSRPVYSGKISATGSFAFKVANTRVKAINGLNNSIIANHKIIAYKQNPDGSSSYFTFSNTDASGFVDFQLADIASQPYIFKAVSLSDGRTWESESITSAGTSNFVIGNKLLNVSLINALDSVPLANINITAYIRMPDDSLKWSQEKTTDSNGKLDFDLEGLGSGSTYVLSSAPYGVQVFSENIVNTGSFKMQAGAVAVTLRKKATGAVIQNYKLSLYEKTAPGKIEWRASSVTNQAGKVQFDPIKLNSGKVYLVAANNIFGNNNNYYSQWITSKGSYEFSVDPNDPHRLDEEAPIFDYTYPHNHAVLADAGFELKMQITDNNTVNKVTALVIDPIKGSSLIQASLFKNNWILPVSAAMISKNQTITIQAEATDQAGNKSTANYQYNIINDVEKPILNITSHQSADQIDENGFLLTGTVTDNTGEVKLVATVIDPIKGIIIDHREVEIGRNHHWALLTKDLSRGEDIIVSLDSIDSSNNITNSQILLSVMTESNNMIQLINRITYGATPDLIKELRDFGAHNFIQQQLHPELIDDTTFEQQLNNIVDESNIHLTLRTSQVSRAINSKRQLLEIMTQFWESHFNTDLSKTKTVAYEYQEQTLFRENALGNFRDLLQISATSPAMLKYLDNEVNYKDEPNENYARELMELHTLGVDNGYTPNDIAEVARVFTGWGIRSGAFYFNSWRHDDEEKFVLDTTIPSGKGVVGGEMVLDLLAEHESTAKFLCTKLLNVFISDSPTTNSIDQCTSTFLTHANKDNQIALVLESIFNSVAFSDSLNFHNKVKTPFEFIIGLYRQLPIIVGDYTTRISLSSMGMPLNYYSLPTGWPEKATDLVNSSQLIQRWQFTNSVLFQTESKARSYISAPHTFLIEQGIETTEGVLGYLFELLLIHDYTELEWNEAYSLLTSSQSETFDIYSPDAEITIRNLIASMLQYPTYQLQ